MAATLGPRIARRLALGIVLLATAAVADAGWLIVDGQGNETLVAGGRLKTMLRQGDGQSMVLDVSRARVWVADAGRRVYWEGTVDEYCRAAHGTMAAAEAQVAEHVRSLPSSQREQVAQMMRQLHPAPAARAGPHVTVERTGETLAIAGLPAQKYRVLADGKLYEELWLAVDPALTGELDLARAPDTFGRLVACLAGSGGEGVESTSEYRQVFAQGWPLRAVRHGRGKPTDRAVVTRVERREVPEADFAPPAGFRAAPLAEVFGQPR
jgi:hypothetical protein